MSSRRRIPYYDLREEALAGTLPAIVGRAQEIERLDRIIGQHTNNNVLIVGPGGSGKTAIVHGWIEHLSRSARYKSYALIQMSTEHIWTLDGDTASDEKYAEAFGRLPSCVLCIDDFGREVSRDTLIMQRVHRLYKPLLSRPDIHLVLTLDPAEYAMLEREHAAFVQSFETIVLKSQNSFEHMRILSRKVPRLNGRHRVIIPDDSLRDIVSYAQRFPSLGQLPRSAIRLLDESIAFSAAHNHKVLTQETVARVVETKTGIPNSRLGKDDLEGIKRLEDDLNARIVDQKDAIRKIALTLQRAKLGLRNPARPLGSFLLLGPSGVGKTETAKNVAEIMFGRPENFVRIDMSEFQQEHAIGRLIGAPPGYVGYEEGGALTNALSREPYSLILLDEIEKAHQKVFDVFLQVLDDGRLTSGKNETVDARNAIIMATSNCGVPEILEAHARGASLGDESVIREFILPALTNAFRPEFINRFDNILIFKPLSTESLMEIARLEIKKIEQRFARHHVQFDIEPESIMDELQRRTDPRFGARPVKRFIEETCETLLAQSLMSR